MRKFLSRLSKQIPSSSPSLTLSDDGKKALLINQIQQLGAQIYLEGVKREMVRKKALTDRKQPREFAALDGQLRARVNAMEDEQQHLIGTLRELDPAYGEPDK